MSALSSFLLCLVFSAAVFAYPCCEDTPEAPIEMLMDPTPEPQRIDWDQYSAIRRQSASPCLAEDVTTTVSPCEVTTTTTTTTTTTAAPCIPSTTTVAPCQQAPTTTLSPCQMEASAPELVFDSCHCPNGWVSYMDSCYMIERDQTATMPAAEHACRQLGATLFVANSQEEFATITQNANKHVFSWIGLYKQTEAEEAHWQMDTCFDYKNQINWLIRPFVPSHNGWTTVSQCAAHFNSPFEAGRYSYFYPCSLHFNFICERNSTIAGTSSQQADRYFF